MNAGPVDIHAHFAPPTTPAQRDAFWKAMRAGCFLLDEPPHWTPEGTLAAMERAGVRMQLLSSVVPGPVERLRPVNDYGAALVAEFPTRFGLLAALPTDDPAACLAEIARAGEELGADGYAVATAYNGVRLADPRLEPVWAALDARAATVFVHPDVFAPPVLGRPSALVEVAFDTASTVTELLYAGVLRRHRRVRLVLAHCGGALPALSGRLLALGAEAWVPNPAGLTRQEIGDQLAALHLDTAGCGSAHAIAPALAMTTADHLVYGSDWGAPCTTEESMAAARADLAANPLLTDAERDGLWQAALRLLPTAAARLAGAAVSPGEARPVPR
ncbi:amidohydrolase family protein [Streptomyces sp. NBC_01198]|uniref:amidohydrolase family protein n=1 Tax=Streptomyces sp. NBC_01198 TaxID=2903769 RepID=UPI002E152E53|nr:amidohydrolase [Streptomyces sp. NBC_01198]